MSSISGGSPRVGAQRRTARIAAAVLTALVAGLYVGVFFVQLPHIHELDNPAPAYLLLAAVYAAGVVVLAVWDKPVLQGVGAIVQGVLIGLFCSLLALLYREGDESFILDMAALAIAITAGQVVLLALLAGLATGRPASLARH